MKNIGQTDKYLRLAIGLGIMAWGLYIHTMWGLLGLLPLFFMVLGWSPLYAVLGISTLKKKKN